MKRVAAFVDAGYFWVQSCSLITGLPPKETRRNQITVNFEELRAHFLTAVSEQFADVELLRVYWYDGPGLNGKTTEHLSIDNLDDFKLRLGTRNGVGQQKGVDGLIIADLISLTQQKAISHAMLVSGDADIAPGVIAAQSMGLRVHLLSIGSANATSPLLTAEVDAKRTWALPDVQRYASRTVIVDEPVAHPAAAPAGPAMIASDGHSVMTSLAMRAKSEIESSQDQPLLSGLSRASARLPREIDGKLLRVAALHFGRPLEEDEKREIRAAFKALFSPT